MSLTRFFRSSFRKKAIVVSCILVAFATTNAFATVFYSRQTGNWNANTTWSTVGFGGAAAGSFPVAGDDVNIGGGLTITVNVNSACATLTYESGAGNTNLVTINSGFTLTISGAVTIPRTGGGNTNTLDVGAGTLSAGSMAFTNGGSGAGGNKRHFLTISTGTATITGNVTQVGSTGSATITFSGAGLLQLGGTFLDASTCTFTASTGTVTYNGAAQTLGDFTYYNLTLAGSGAKNMSTGGGVTTINNNFVMSGTATAAPTVALTVTGNVTLGAGTTLAPAASLAVGVDFTLSAGSTFTGGTLTHTIAGNWTNNGGTFNNANSIINLNGAAQTIGGSSSTSFNSLFLTGSGTKTFGIATICGDELSIATGIVANLGSITTHSSRILTMGGSGQVPGSWGSTASAATNKNNTFFTAGTTGILNVTNAGFYSRLTGNWNSNTSWSNVGFGGAVASSFPAAGDDVNIGGGVTITVNVNSASSTLTYESGAANTNQVTINSGITLNVSGLVTIARPTNPNTNTLAVGAGILNAGSMVFSNGGGGGGQRHLLTISTGTATITGDVTQAGSTGSATITFTGSGLLKLGGAFLNSTNATFTQSTGTVEYNGGAQTVGDFTYNNLTLSGSGVKDLSTVTGVTAINNNLVMNGTASATAAAALTIGGGVTLSAGTSFTAGAFTHNVAGSWTNNGTTFVNTNSTINFNGVAQTIGGSSSTTFNNLLLAGSGTKTFGIAIFTNANLTINTGVVANLGAIITHTARTLTLGGTGQLAGTWGSTASAATNKNNTFFTAGTTGILTVTNAAYYSRLTGNWNANATWSTVGFGGAAASSFPVTGDDVNIGGAFTITVNVNSACGTLTYEAAGNTNLVTINSGITLAVSGAVTIPRANNPNTNTMAVGAGTLTAGSIAFTNGGTGGGQRHILTISTGTTTVTGDVTQVGSTGSATITFTGSGLLQLGGAFLNSGNATFTRSTGTVEYNGGAQAVGDFTYYTLTLSGSGAKDLSTVTGVTAITNNFVMNGTASASAAAALTIGGSVTLSSGTSFTAGAFTHNVAGNWSNNGATFVNTNSTINLNGTAAQTIGGTASNTFYNLTLNNTFGTVPQITIGSSTTTLNNLTMTSGVVNLAGFTFTLGSSGTPSTLSRTASTTTNWMYGGTLNRFWLSGTAVSSTIANLYGLFPVGSSTASSYRPVAINSNASPTATGSFSVTHTNATTSTDLSPFYSDAGTNIVRKNDAQFVTATTATGGTYDIAVTMTGLLAGTLSDIRLAVSNAATTVTDFGTHLAATGTAPNPTAARTGGLISLANLVGDWRITTINKAATPLPIELLSFNATFQQRRVQLDWSTASELNNDFFTIERASDVEKFEKLAVVKGNGTKVSQTNYALSDENPLYGNSYYRLKQTDFSGAISYSKIVSVNVPESATWTIYPNPSSGSEFMISFASTDLGKDAYVKVQDLGGKEIFQIQATGLNTTQLRIVSPQTLSPGLYIVSIVIEQQVMRQKLMVH